jgi:hypothetical protein
VFWFDTESGGDWLPNVSSVSLRRSSIVGLDYPPERAENAAREPGEPAENQNRPLSAFAAWPARWNSGEGKMPKKIVAAAKPTATKMSSG